MEHFDNIVDAMYTAALKGAGIPSCKLRPEEMARDLCQQDYPTDQNGVAVRCVKLAARADTSARRHILERRLLRDQPAAFAQLADAERLIAQVWKEVATPWEEPETQPAKGPGSGLLRRVAAGQRKLRKIRVQSLRNRLDAAELMIRAAAAEREDPPVIDLIPEKQGINAAS